MATVFVAGPTAGMTTMEFEPGGVIDLREAARAAGPGGRTTTSTTAVTTTPTGTPTARVDRRAVGEGPRGLSVLALGNWQQIVLIDFDDPPRERRHRAGRGLKHLVR